MTVEVTLLSTPARCRVDFRSATIAADLVAVRPAPRVCAQLLPRSRISAAMLALSLATGILIHPTATLDVQVLTPVIIGLSELEEMYNYTDLLGRYIVTADGLVFEVKEV